MVEGRIKSALEKALERAESFPEVSAEEIARIENVPRGRSIGASFMNNRAFDLGQAMAEVPGDILTHVSEGVQEVLLMSITLSAEEEASGTSRRAMEGLMLLKRDRKQAAALLGEMDQLLQYYSQAIEQTRERFKQDFEARSRATRMQGARDRGMDRMGFREEWSSVLRQLNSRFEGSLAELKERIRALD